VEIIYFVEGGFFWGRKDIAKEENNRGKWLGKDLEDSGGGERGEVEGSTGIEREELKRIDGPDLTQASNGHFLTEPKKQVPKERELGNGDRDERKKKGKGRTKNQRREGFDRVRRKGACETHGKKDGGTGGEVEFDVTTSRKQGFHLRKESSRQRKEKNGARAWLRLLDEIRF